MNYIIEINGCIQKIIWEGGLLRSIDIYKALRSCLRSTNEQEILNSLWISYPYDHARTYTKLVKKFIHGYVNWVTRKTDSLTYGVSIRKRRNLKLRIPKLPKVTYDLPLELKNRLDDSIPVHSMRLP